MAIFLHVHSLSRQYKYLGDARRLVSYIGYEHSHENVLLCTNYALNQLRNTVAIIKSIIC